MTMEQPEHEKLANHLMQEEKELEDAEKNLKEAVQHIEELKKGIRELEQYLEEEGEDATWPMPIGKKILQGAQGTIELVEKADQELKEVLQEAEVDKERLIEKH